MRADGVQGQAAEGSGVSLAGAATGQMYAGQAKLSVILKPYFSRVSTRKQVVQKNMHFTIDDGHDSDIVLNPFPGFQE